ncbi:L,D-transpeptidase family protein [Phenylobacterium immobile]|uniref:L,D-transpeptidase family protein n=1 Tax=Phenylobacterium immobile TaxID=21 RepID=UPI000B08B06E|nr:L,D-transpeptidase family protein [Phenylobacterium immobile]
MTHQTAILSPRPRGLLLSLLAIVAGPLLLGLAACGGDGATKLSRSDAAYAVEVLERAPEHGFATGSFNIAAVKQAREDRDPQAEAMLHAALADYARAQHGLLIPAKSRPAAWGMKPAAYDAEPALDSAIAGKTFRAWLDEQPPTSGLYIALQKAYVAARDGGRAAEAATLRANLERVRWLPRTDEATRVDVNIASATMTYFVDGRPQITMRTASGKPGDETPILTSSIDHIVLNPPWNVPDGIANEELRPKGGAYLAANNFTTKEDGRLMQKPGPNSALGLVKFDFDNPYAVYLHDTPSKAAFGRDDRAVSHGCVRLERAMDLAGVLLATRAGWTPEQLGEAMAKGETKTVKLDQPVPVRLLYLTAVPNGGAVTFLEDVYGWDAQVLERMDRRA